MSLLIISSYAQAKQNQDYPNKVISTDNTVIENATAADIISSLETPPSKKKVNKPPTMSGSAELGFLYKTGNTNSGDIKTGLDFRFEKDSWLSLLNIDLLIKKADITD